MVKDPPLESEVLSSPPGRVFSLLFLIFNDKCLWQLVKKFAYASFANLLLPIIRGLLLLGMTWPVYKNDSLFTSSKVGRYQMLINKTCAKIYKQEKKRPVEGTSISYTNHLH